MTNPPEREVGLRAMALRQRRETEKGRPLQKQQNKEANETWEGKECGRGYINY